MILWDERAIALIWWICAIVIGPVAVIGFFVGGWLILAALWAVWMNMTLKNPFASADSRRSKDSERVAHRSDARIPGAAPRRGR